MTALTITGSKDTQIHLFKSFSGNQMQWSWVSGPKKNIEQSALITKNPPHTIQIYHVNFTKSAARLPPVSCREVMGGYRGFFAGFIEGQPAWNVNDYVPASQMPMDVEPSGRWWEFIPAWYPIKNHTRFHTSPVYILGQLNLESTRFYCHVPTKI